MSDNCDNDCDGYSTAAVLRFDLREMQRHYAEAKAQVERLTRERDEMRAERDEALRAEREAWRQTDAVRIERDAARYEYKTLKRERDEAFRRGAEAQQEADLKTIISTPACSEHRHACEMDETVEHLADRVRATPLVTEVKP